MRKLVYDCFFKGIKIATVSTLKDVETWKAKGNCYNVKEKLETVEKEETPEERAERLRVINKRNERRKMKKVAAVG